MAKKRGGGGANWMDTYGDMVTLLLCFFVLLYSMSTISTDKWKALVQSFNPNAVPNQTDIESGNDGPSSDPEPSDANPDMTPEEMLEAQAQEIAEALEQLYQALKEYVDNSQHAAQIDLTKGDGYVFISFNEAVFFAPNKYDLLPEGVTVLAEISSIINNTAQYVDEIKVMGHTAQADMSRPNYTMEDRLISSSRAAVASAFLQDHAPDINPARIISEGFGMHRGIASNQTEDGKKQNRRVEILISGKDVFSQMGDCLERYDTVSGSNTAAAEKNS